jgi:hypothetical protein
MIVMTGKLGIQKNLICLQYLKLEPRIRGESADYIGAATEGFNKAGCVHLEAPAPYAYYVTLQPVNAGPIPTDRSSSIFQSATGDYRA